MEYSEDESFWMDCTDVQTWVYPGQYYVRYKAAQGYPASEAVYVSVPGYTSTDLTDPPTPGVGIIAMYSGSTKVMEFTQDDIDALMVSAGTHTFSTYNTWPT